VGLNHGLFTRQVSDDVLFLCPHLSRFRRFGALRQLPNCRI
jgi:hypothetical protein